MIIFTIREFNFKIINIYNTIITYTLRAFYYF